MGARGPTLLGAGFLYRILSPTGLVSKLTDFLSSLSYIRVQRPLLLAGVTVALIQPIHSQSYNSDIPRPDAPVIYTGAFPILTARPGRRSIYNSSHWRPDLKNKVDVEAIQRAIHVVLPSLQLACDMVHCQGERPHFLLLHLWLFFGDYFLQIHQ